MLLGSFTRKVEERVEKESRDEILRIAAEWDRLSPQQKSKQSLTDFFSARLLQLDEERESRGRDREARRDDPYLFRALLIPFGHIPYFGWE